VGAVTWHDTLLLAQRSNGRDPGDAIVVLDLKTVLDDLAQGHLSARALRAVVPVALGDLDGVPLGFTDLAAHAGGVHFVAAAEATDDPVEDAPCAGSIIGRLDAQFRIAGSARLRPDLKIEGLHHWKGEGARERWLLVADADDPASRSPLLTVATDRG
jgi:hypothetical protein